MSHAATELTGTERQILTAVRDRMAEIAGRPDAPAHLHWEQIELDELRRYGPRYSPTEWFGGGHALPEKIRVRYLRAVNKLIGTKLLVGTTTEGGRLTWLKLTAAGAAATAESH